MSRLFNDIENDVIMYMFFICWFNYIFSFRHKAGLLTSACSVWNLHTTMHKYIFTQGGNTHKVWSTEMFLHAIINKNYHHTIDRRGLQLCISTFTQICLTWKNICIILMYWLLLLDIIKVAVLSILRWTCVTIIPGDIKKFLWGFKSIAYIDDNYIRKNIDS